MVNRRANDGLPEGYPTLPPPSSTPEPTYATFTHVTEDGRMEAYRLEFVLGDRAYTEWRNFRMYWMQQPREAGPGTGRELPEVANTHVFYVNQKGETEEFHVILRDADAALWLGHVDNQRLPDWAYRGSGRRPSRAQKLSTWQERKSRSGAHSRNIPTGYGENIEQWR